MYSSPCSQCTPTKSPAFLWLGLWLIKILLRNKYSVPLFDGFCSGFLLLFHQQWFLNVWTQTSSSTWELVRNANFGVIPRATESEALGVAGSVGFDRPPRKRYLSTRRHEGKPSRGRAAVLCGGVKGGVAHRVQSQQDQSLQKTVSGASRLAASFDLSLGLASLLRMGGRWEGPASRSTELRSRRS